MPDVIGQPPSQPSSVIAALSDGFGGTGGTTTLATGLGSECSVIACGIDQTFPSRQLLAFLSSVDSGDGTWQTRLTVRITDDAGAYSDALNLAINPSSKIRNMTFFDVTRDGLLDLVVTEQVSGEQGRVLVFPRSSDGFGTPVMSPITLRGSAFDAGADDFVIGDYVSETDEPKVDLFVLGSDRVRLHKARADGVFASDSDLQIADGTTPLGMAGAIVDIGSVLGVVVGDQSDPDSRAILVYHSNAESPTLLRYTVTAETGASRPVFGKFGGNATLDVAIVDGTTITTYLDIGPPVVTDKAEWRVRPTPGQSLDPHRKGAFDEVNVALNRAMPWTVCRGGITSSELSIPRTGRARERSNEPSSSNETSIHDSNGTDKISAEYPVKSIDATVRARMPRRNHVHDQYRKPSLMRRQQIPMRDLIALFLLLAIPSAGVSARQPAAEATRTLDGSATLGRLVTRTDPEAMPLVPTLPAANGTRIVVLNVPRQGAGPRTAVAVRVGFRTLISPSKLNPRAQRAPSN